MMIKFGTAAIMGSLAHASTSQQEGTFTMKASHIRAEKGGMADVIHDTNFKLDSGNQSYFLTDVSALYAEPTTSNR